MSELIETLIEIMEIMYEQSNDLEHRLSISRGLDRMRNCLEVCKLAEGIYYGKKES